MFRRLSSYSIALATILFIAFSALPHFHHVDGEICFSLEKYVLEALAHSSDAAPHHATDSHDTYEHKLADKGGVTPVEETQVSPATSQLPDASQYFATVIQHETRSVGTAEKALSAADSRLYTLDFIIQSWGLRAPPAHLV